MLDDASSSPSDSLTVAHIHSLRRLAGFSRVTLSDETWIPLPSSISKGRGLAPGQTLAYDEYRELYARGWREYAYALGLDLLARRESSAFDLRRKLATRGVPEEALSAAMELLAAEGSVDDRRFAAAWIESQIRSRPQGRTSLVAGLRRHGVSREIAREAVSHALDHDPARLEELFDRAATRLLRRKGMTPQRAVRSLLRLGFSTERVYRWSQSQQSQQSD